MEQIDCAVIGAGVVGLAIARALAMRGREVMILEAEEGIGTQTSSRNSEVIHAGISYAPGSLKGRFCAAGNPALYAYCAERGIGHRRIGKLLVATEDDDVPELQLQMDLGAAQGVADLRLLGADEARALEPEVSCVAAVYSPSTGIVDSHAMMLAYLGDAENHGATLALKSPVTGGTAAQDGVVLRVGAAGEAEVACRTVVNAAGLGAQRVAASIAGMPAALVPPLYYAIGHYFALGRRSPFRHLVYPAARDGSLRVHVTLDLGGQCKFGPDFSWRDGVDYRFDMAREASFYPAIRRYWPHLRDGDLRPGYTGIRPRLHGPGASLHHAASDFVVQDEGEHGVRGLVNLFGIESPGLTSALPLADFVAERVAAHSA